MSGRASVGGELVISLANYFSPSGHMIQLWIKYFFFRYQEFSSFFFFMLEFGEFPEYKVLQSYLLRQNLDAPNFIGQFLNNLNVNK